MPFPLAAAIMGGSALGGGVIDAFATGAMNKKSRAWHTQMYERQKHDSLAFWNMQNEYNSPAAQMQRFTEAGLNPNLIYGQQNTGGSIDVPAPGSPQFETPQVGRAVGSGVATAINAMYDLEAKQANIDNLHVQNDILKQEAIFKGLLNAGKVTGNKQAILDFNKSQDLYGTDIDSRKTALQKMKTEIDLSLRRDAREAVQSATSVKEAIERMMNMAQQREYVELQKSQSKAETARIREDTRRIRENFYMLEREGVIKELEIGLRQMGLNPNDETWKRMLGMFLSNATRELSGGVSLSKLLFGK